MQYYRLRDLVAIFGIDESGVRRYLKKKGFVFEKRRFGDSGNQLSLCLDAHDFNRAKDIREKDGFELNK